MSLYVLTCVVLIVAVLLQPGKSDAAALFGGGASQTAFGPRGTQNFLGYVTITAAVLFLGVGLLFGFSGVLGPRSVVHSASDTATPPVAPPIPAPPIQPLGVSGGTPAAEAPPAAPAGTEGSQSKPPAATGKAPDAKP
ncbi:MAG: preprotein translocase subunit SecG [Acidobacteria bacterium]|nr:preprotein translocase subunit SecG [Acidobacteriota bacterium]